MRGDTREGRRRWGATAIAVALALGLAACDPGDTEDPTPSGDGTTTSSGPTVPVTTESSSDAPTPPDAEAPTPAPEMLVDDREGAAAAVEYFFALVHYARVTGDTTALESLSGQACGSCESLIATVAEVHGDGGWFESDPYVLSDVRVAYPTADEPGYAVVLVLDEPAGVTHLGDGADVAIDAATYPDVVAVALWSADGFHIDGVDLDAEG